MRIEYAYYVVKEKNGRDVRLHADKTMQMIGQLKQGDHVEAEVTDQNHTLRMRPLPWADFDRLGTSEKLYTTASRTSR